MEIWRRLLGRRRGNALHIALVPLGAVRWRGGKRLAKSGSDAVRYGFSDTKKDMTMEQTARNPRAARNGCRSSISESREKKKAMARRNS